MYNGFDSKILLIFLGSCIYKSECNFYQTIENNKLSVSKVKDWNPIYLKSNDNRLGHEKVSSYYDNNKSNAFINDKSDYENQNDKLPILTEYENKFTKAVSEVIDILENDNHTISELITDMFHTSGN